MSISKTMKTVRTVPETYGAYTDGAGSDWFHVSNNNWALYHAATAAGIPVSHRERTDIPAYEAAEEPIIVALGELEIGFDRWGYCSNQGGLDQVGFEFALAHLQNAYDKAMSGPPCNEEA